MFEKNSITIETDPNGLFSVISREYRINHFIYTVIMNDLKIIVEMSLDTVLNIADKCNVRFISGKEFMILPEKIKASF